MAEAPSGPKWTFWRVLGSTVVPLLLAAAATLVLAGFSRTSLPGSSAGPGAWVGASAGAVLLSSYLAHAARERGSVRAVVLTAIGLVVGAVVLGALAARLFPAARDGLGVRPPLAVLGFAVAVLAGLLMVATAGSGRDTPRGPLRFLVSGLVFVVVAALAVGVVRWTDDRNLAVTEAGGAPGRVAAPVLTGSVAWQRSPADLGAEPFDPPQSTAGGVLVATPHGPIMLDPATGARRWQFLRHDTEFNHPTVSTSGDLIVVPGQVAANRPFTASSEHVLWVLDAVTGRVRATMTDPAPDQDTPVVAGGAVIVTTLGGTRAYGLDGTPRWSVPDVCDNGVADVGGTALLCAEGNRVRSLSGADGRPQWTWIAPSAADVVLSGEPVRDAVVVYQAHDRLSGPGATVTSLVPATGTVRWRVSGVLPLSTQDLEESYGYYLVTAGATPVVVLCHATGADATALDPVTGRIAWRAWRLPSCQVNHTTVSNMTGLDDGRLAAIAANGRDLLVVTPPNGRGDATPDRRPLGTTLDGYFGLAHHASTVIAVTSGEATVVALR